jgi:hypothetical protein
MTSEPHLYRRARGNLQAATLTRHAIRRPWCLQPNMLHFDSWTRESPVLLASPLYRDEEISAGGASNPGGDGPLALTPSQTAADSRIPFSRETPAPSLFLCALFTSRGRLHFDTREAAMNRPRAASGHAYARVRARRDVEGWVSCTRSDSAVGAAARIGRTWRLRLGCRGGPPRFEDAIG